MRDARWSTNGVCARRWSKAPDGAGVPRLLGGRRVTIASARALALAHAEPGRIQERAGRDESAGLRRRFSRGQPGPVARLSHVSSSSISVLCWAARLAAARTARSRSPRLSTARAPGGTRVWMPCEASWTSFGGGHRVVSTWRRWLSICSCEISTLKRGISVVVSIVVLMSARFSAAT